MKWNFEVLNKYRFKDRNYPDYVSNDQDTFGAFYIPFDSYILKTLATDGEGFIPRWEHVSVSMPNRTPNWKEMCFIKDLFWGEEEIVIQIHPPKSKYVNQHPNCLHLWRNPANELELPPSIYVGLTKRKPTFGEGV